MAYRGRKFKISHMPGEQLPSLDEKGGPRVASWGPDRKMRYPGASDSDFHFLDRDDWH